MERKLQLDEIMAGYFSPEEKAKREAERDKAEKERIGKVKAAERDYWQAKADHCWQAKKACNLWR